MSEKTEQNFSIARVYTKDLSLESPKAPKIFEQQWNPKLNLEVDVSQEQLNETMHEVTLKLGVTVKNEEEVAFIIEIQQAGVFVVQGFDESTTDHVLGSVCPNILFPYAREIVDSLAVKATFPAPMLAPINFDAMLEQRKSEENQS